MPSKKLKTQITGKVTELGWELRRGRLTHENYAVIRIRVSRSKCEETAENQLNKLRKKLLNRTVVIFPQ